MKQSVDLFPAHLRHDPVVLGALHAVMATGGLLLLLLAVSLVSDFSAARERRTVEAMRADVATQRDALVELEKTHPAITVDEALAEETERLERERNAKASVLALLSQGTLGNRSGFSPHLEALGRHGVSGVWFERVVVSAGGRDVAIEGRAIEGTRVPRMVQALGASEVFGGLSFSSLAMEREREGLGPIRFVLSADPAGAADARETRGPR